MTDRRTAPTRRVRTSGQRGVARLARLATNSSRPPDSSSSLHNTQPKRLCNPHLALADGGTHPRAPSIMRALRARSCCAGSAPCSAGKSSCVGRSLSCATSRLCGGGRAADVAPQLGLRDAVMVDTREQYAARREHAQARSRTARRSRRARRSADRASSSSSADRARSSRSARPCASARASAANTSSCQTRWRACAPMRSMLRAPTRARPRTHRCTRLRSRRRRARPARSRSCTRTG